jgi:hypothetical protein
MIIDEEAAALAKAIETLADERDQMVRELKFAQAHTRARFAISS